jgi:hypothetical protein
VLNTEYYGFNTEDSTKFSPEESTWRSFLEFCKSALPFLNESTQNVENCKH